MTLICCVFALSIFQAMAQDDAIVRGKITAKIDGETLIAVSISEVDKNNRVVNGTVSNYDGDFVLKVKDRNNKLVFSYIGYAKQELKIGNRSVFNVALADDNSLGEVVVTAQKTTNLGGMNVPTREISVAMQRIDAREFEGLQVASVEDALQGRVSGLDIVSNSGEPGAAMSMRIRGATSINGSSQPLIVVNGIPFETNIASDFDFGTAREEQYAELLNVNPDDILDIVVLKDAASTAIWGSKGANGVLQINTKKGAMGKPRVQYSLRITRAYMPDAIPLLNGDQYTMLMKEAYLNQSLNDLNGNIPEYNYQQYAQGDERNAFFWNYNNNTDWFSEVTQVAWKQDHNVSLTGGGERGDYRISFGYLDESGIVIGQGLKRFSNRLDLRYKLSDRVFFSTELAYTYQDNDRIYQDNDKVNYDILDAAMRKMPNVPVYERDKYGNYTDIYFNINRSTSQLDGSQRDMVNPVALVNLARNNEKSYRVIPTFRLQYDILDPAEQMLRFRSSVTMDVNDIHSVRFFPKEATGAMFGDDLINYAYDSENKSSNMILDNNLWWSPKLPEQHSVQAYLSVQTNIGKASGQHSAAYGASSSSIGSTEPGILKDLGSSGNERHSYGIVGTVHYAFLGRYIADFTLRRDESSRFGAAYRVGYFPGVSLKWIISDEAFMKDLKFINLFALRPSWGIVGREPDKDYLYFSKYSTYEHRYMDMAAIYPSGIQIPDLRWEKTTQWNLGVDISMFNDRLNADLNFYHKHTEDLLFKDLKIAGTSGNSSVAYDNDGVMDNDGFELNFHAPKLIKYGKFSMDVNVNFANYYNTIQKISDKVDTKAGNMKDNGEYLRTIQVGNPLGSFYGYRFKGVYQYNEYKPGTQESAPVSRDANGNVLYDQFGVPKPMWFRYGESGGHVFRGGDAIYEDINHDGSIDDLDVVYLGNANPKLQGGFGITLRYHNFSVNSFFHFRYGNKVVNEARMKMENMYYNDNQSVAVSWRWRTDGDDTNMPRALFKDGHNWLGSDRYVEDGSFLRFKYLTFNYTFPKSWTQSAGLSEVKLYCTINNLHVWTNYSGVDPEIGYAASADDRFKIGFDTQKTPRSKDATFGITIGF